MYRKHISKSHPFSDNYAFDRIIGFFQKKPLSKAMLVNVSLYSFESREYTSFSDSHTILKALYGEDYMQLPPLSKQERHILVDLQFGPY